MRDTVDDIIARLRLQAELGMFDTPPEHEHVSYGYAADTLERQASLLESAALALKVFAKCCELIEDDEPDREWAKFRLEVGDYRRAKATLDTICSPPSPNPA